MIEALLFDLYETLVRPDWTVLQAGRDALARRAGLDVEQMREQWHRTHDLRMRGRLGGLEGDLAEMLSGCGVSASPELLQELAQHELANWSAGVRLYEDVVPALSRLRAEGFRMAIVSNASQEAASVIQGLGLDLYFDAVAVSHEVGSLKPEPAMLLHALECLGVTAARAVFVDDVAANIDAARQLGIRGVLMSRKAGCLESAPVYPCVRDLEELRRILDDEHAQG